MVDVLCFRTEAGAHGKESRGLYRVHQFTKAEMFVLCRPEQSAEHHEQLREIEERLLQALGIAYRVVNVCSGELGAPALKKYDIEGWMPGRGAYGEVTSCSSWVARQLVPCVCRPGSIWPVSILYSIPPHLPRRLCFWKSTIFSGAPVWGAAKHSINCSFPKSRPGWLPENFNDWPTAGRRW